MEFMLEREDLISILMSILCGGILGFEREYSNKAAGFRTIILICLGSTILYQNTAPEAMTVLLPTL
jgi:putative Mg2+ transporter-C (MgtC) family protein